MARILFMHDLYVKILIGLDHLAMHDAPADSLAVMQTLGHRHHRFVRDPRVPYQAISSSNEALIQGGAWYHPGEMAKSSGFAFPPAATSPRCYLCRSRSMRALEPLDAAVSVTTDGQVVPLPLCKTQCATCGLIQTTHAIDDIFARLSYQENYAFYDRPNMRVFDAARYERYARWVASHFPRDLDQYRVLEVGCGAGWVLEHLTKLHPTLRVEGIEPSRTTSRAAAEAGLQVVRAAADAPDLDRMHGRFDFVYSINVIEHTPDPVGFVRAMARFVRSGGALCVTCPNGDLVNMDPLFIDHLYTIRPANLWHMFERAGVAPAQWSHGPAGLTEFQQLTGRPASEPVPITSYACATALLQARNHHIRQWRALDDRLSEKLETHTDVLCFGAGEMSDVMAALAPRTWRQIVAHVIDPVEPSLRETMYRGKRLYYMDDPELARYDTLLLGVKPHYHELLRPRLGERFAHLICWDDLVDNQVDVSGD